MTCPGPRSAGSCPSRTAPPPWRLRPRSPGRRRPPCPSTWSCRGWFRPRRRVWRRRSRSPSRRRPPSGRFRGRPSRGCRPSPRHRRRCRPWIRCPACRCPPIPSMPGWRHRVWRRSCPPPLRCSWRFVPRAGLRARSYHSQSRRRRYPRCCLFRAGHGSSNPSRPSRRRPTGCRCVPIPRRPARGRPPCPGGRLSHYRR